MSLHWYPQDAQELAEHPHDEAGDAGAAHEVHAADHDVAGDAPFDPMAHFLNPAHLIEHVQDSYYWELPGGKVELPQLFAYTDEQPLIAVPKNDFVAPVTLRISKFMILEVIAAILIATAFIWLGRKVQHGDRPRGRLWNLLEAMLVYLRDDVVRPAIGGREADRYIPLMWTFFFFILTLNLLGLIPFMGSPTGALGCTAALAVLAFAVVIGSGVKKMGVLGYLKAQAPHIDLPLPMAIMMIPGIWLIEVFSLLIKHMVLAVRLFANMFAGHLVLAAFVAFIAVSWGSWLKFGIVPTVICSSVMISLLELAVAFIQAYVFTFLTALFIGSALHPH